MMPAQTPAPRGARWRARVAACLRSESGDTLIEILITAVVVALIAGATLTGYAQIQHLGGLDRHRNEATALAQQDEARLRGLTITELSGNGTGTGNTSKHGRSSTGPPTRSPRPRQFVSGSRRPPRARRPRHDGSADEVETTSSVTWDSDDNVHRW